MTAVAVGLIAKTGVNTVIEQLAVGRAEITGVLVEDYSNVKLIGSYIFETGKGSFQHRDEWLLILPKLNCQSITGTAVCSSRNAEITVMHCAFKSNAGSGVVASDNAIARISDSKCDGGQAGLAAFSGAQLTVQNCTSTRCQFGFQISGSGRCSFTKFLSKKCEVGFGSRVPAGDVVLDQCTVKMFRSCGFTCTGGRSWYQMTICCVEGSTEKKIVWIALERWSKRVRKGLPFPVSRGSSVCSKSRHVFEYGEMQDDRCHWCNSNGRCSVRTVTV